jgi:hypothetical protein
MRMVLLALVAGGCVVEHHQEPSADPPVQPRTCAADLTLDGAGTGSTKLGPMQLDTSGTSICLHLDATNNRIAAHFMSSTDSMPGSTSPFAAVLQDASFATLQDGWDVTVGETAPATFENLEWNAPLHAVTDTVLWVHATGDARTTSISVALFEPFE